MSRDEIVQRLQGIFDEVFLEKVTVTPELSAHEVEEWDSLVHISLMIAVENAFHVKFRVGEVEALQNVGELADLIGRRLNGSK